jgi:hypothetical protein
MLHSFADEKIGMARAFSLRIIFVLLVQRIHKNWCTFQNLISIRGDLKPHHVLLRPLIVVFLYYIIKHTKYWKLKCSVCFLTKLLLFKVSYSGGAQILGD